MKFYLLFIAMVVGFGAFAQPAIYLRLNNKNVQLKENVSTFGWKTFNTGNRAVGGKKFALVQFNQTPDANTQKLLRKAGIELTSYIPDFAYTAAISADASVALLKQAGVRYIGSLESQYKIDRRLQGISPVEATKKSGKVDVLVHLNKGIAINTAMKDLEVQSFEPVDITLSQYHILSVRISKSAIQQLAALPYVEYMQPISPADKPLNDEVRSNTRANVLNAPLGKGGENLRGQGVVVGVGDDADVGSHVDLQGKVISRAAFIYNNHGTHTSGTIAGGGIREALYQGIAPLATILDQLFGGIYKNAKAYVADFGMVITNNSYGAITGDCSYAGVYDLYSKVLDEQAFELPELLHVFAAGNDGTQTCPGYAMGYHTVLGGYQSAKNVLTVGWGEKNATSGISGSDGPTTDGRIKPEITATGSEVRSTSANNNYQTDWGSSMASPNVAGGAALLVEKYRQLHGGANPKSGLLKALLMNGASDIDNAGPDFKSGFGWINLSRSLAMMKDGRMITGTIAQGATNNHQVVVPAGTSQVKVMVYWHDPAAAIFSAATLVNDVDLEFIDPANTTVLPWKLDTISANIASLATRAADHSNNVEQVTLNNPQSGSYTIRLKGTAINAGATQEYFVVYDFLPPAIDLTFPSVGEPLVAGETVTVNWDAWDNSPNTFTLQYSVDNGANWTNLSTNIAATARQYIWVVPFLNTPHAKMRLQRNNTLLADESQPFVIAADPMLSAGSTQCEGYFQFNWTTVPGATDYEVMMKQGVEMVGIALTTATSYTIGGLHKDSVYWVTIRPRLAGNAGRRANALRVQPNSGTCAGSISDNDLKPDSIIAPVTGRLFTASQISSTGLKVRIKNLDDAPVTQFEVKYSVNNGAFVSELVNVAIPALGTYTHTFAGVDFRAPGNYMVRAVVKNLTTDPVAQNDTLTTTIRQLQNTAITLPYTESFEAAPASETTIKTIGLPGLDQWDFSSSTPYGRIRSFINSGFAYSGNRAITIDVNQFVETGNTNFLTGTFNLSAYDAANNEVRFDFWYNQHGRFVNANNRVWIRGSDTSPWIEAFNLDSNQAMFAGTWRKSASIEVSDLLLNNGQNFSTSFQVRFGQTGIIGTADAEHNGGYTIDDIRLYTAEDDIHLVSILLPTANGCGFGASEAVTVRVKNMSQNPVNNIPVNLQVNGGVVITEVIPSIQADAFVDYTFSQRANLAALGTHSLSIWTSLGIDTYKQNDSLLHYTIRNQPLISTFPYLQNFEEGPGSWYAEGRNSSWEFGSPASLKINKAASGNNAWKTTLRGTYNDDELSYLYSPCFNLSGLQNPYLSLSLAMDIEQCKNILCDAAWMEYSTDGLTWTKLGANKQGSNWYNRPDDNVWDSAGFTRWHSASVPLPAGVPSLRLRVVMKSDELLIKEGIAIDDIHIYDQAYEIYTGPTISTPITQTVAGNNWQHFINQNKIVASINPQGNNLGSTGVQVFFGPGGIDNATVFNNQYFLTRNITIKPANTNLAANATVRLYFTDAEVDSLVQAGNCAACSKPADAYAFGVTQYDDGDDSRENGSFEDNLSGLYSIIQSPSVVKVPYDRGYYAEFSVQQFSEFWLSKTPGNTAPLPLTLLSFTATKNNGNTLLKWTTANEQNVDRFEVEVAVGNEAYQRGTFERLATVAARNNASGQYQTTDLQPLKKGAFYYRLKMIDKDGRWQYSEVRVIRFDEEVQWTVYPNPVHDVLQVITQAEAGSKITIRLMNVVGQPLLNRSVTASGFIDKTQIDVQQLKLTAGTYIIRIDGAESTRHFKVVKQ